MKRLNKILLTGLATGSLTMLLLTSTSFKSTLNQKAVDLIQKMEEVNGGWEKLRSKKNVEFTYVYKDEQKGTDVSIERYVFDDELSWGDYLQHEVNVFPDEKGKPGSCTKMVRHPLCSMV